MYAKLTNLTKIVSVVMSMDTLITIVVLVVIVALVGWSVWRTMTGRGKPNAWGCSCGKSADECCSQGGQPCDKSH